MLKILYNYNSNYKFNVRYREDLMKKVVVIVFSIIMLLFVSACNGGEVSITDVSFDQSVLESSYEIADFSIEDYYLIVEFSDGTTKQVAITEAMISSSDLAKLSVSGTQIIEVLYQGYKVSITVTLSDTTDELTVLLTSIYTTGVSEGTITDMTYEEWLESIRGEQGLPGEDGIDGKQVTFQVSEGFIQWQYVGDSAWTNLVSLSTLTGADGTNGTDGIDGREVLFQVADGFIQWQYSGDTTWTNLVSLSTLTGADGTNGTDGIDGKQVTFQVSEGFIQWQYVGDSAWTNLVSLSTLTGADGQDGTNGVDGKEVLFQVSDGYIQWQYTGDTTWTNLVELTTLVGPAGSDGIDGIDGREVLFQVAEGYIQWQYTGDTVWTNLVSLSTLTGADGEDGLSAYQIYLQYHPEYTKTEEEWIYDLINGLLSDKIQATVTFDSLGGTLVESQNIDKYTSATEPQDPEKDGYVFKYWEYQSHEWIFFGYVVSQDITLVAHYDIVPYQITYILGDGATNNENNPVSYNVETDTFVLQDPYKDGFLFTGWTYPGQELPTTNVEIEKGTTGSIEFTAHWYELNTSGYNTEQTEEDENGIIDTFYYIEFYDDTFLFITSNLYYTGTFVSIPQYGNLIDLGDNVYELDFIDEGVDSVYILIDEEGIYFCDEFGNFYDPNSGNVGRVDFDGSNLDFELYGYGYFDLSSQQNYVAKKALYEELALLCEAFAVSTDDISPVSGKYLLDSFDLETYGLSVEEAISTFKLFLLDHPEVYWLSNTIDIFGTEFNVYIQEEYALYSYRHATNDAIGRMFAEAELLINENMNELEIALALHDFIILRVDYAYEADGVTPQDAYWAHNIEGVATGIGAVCESYAETYKLLADHFGITSILVTGDSNGQGHMWNIVSINGEFYHIDVTWDDAGGESISYTYFGMSYSSISSNHDLDLPIDAGVEYLYQLPLISEDDIELVKLSYDGVDLGWFVSIEKAFELMDDTNGNYEIELFEYNKVGPLVFSQSVRKHHLPSISFPVVNSIKFIGKYIELGNGWFTLIDLVLIDNIYLNSNVEFLNISIISEDNHTIYLGNNQIVFSGKSNKISSINIVGDEYSEMIVYTFTESYANINVSTLTCNNEAISLRGEYNYFDYIHYIGGRITVYGGVKEINIGVLSLNENYDDNLIFNLANIEGTILNIGEIHNDNPRFPRDEYDIFVSVSNIMNMPMINIFGTSDINICYEFNPDITYMSTDIQGNEIDRWIINVNLYDHGSLPILYAPNMDTEQFSVKYKSLGGDFTDLYIKDEEGYYYRYKDYHEVILDNVLIEVVSMNGNETNTYYIPEGVTEISGFAFYSYQQLTEVIMPDTLLKINSGAFAFCKGIKKIIIPNSVTIIEDWAIYLSPNLTEIIIPNSVIIIGEYAIPNLSNLTIYIENGTVIDGWDINWSSGDDSTIIWDWSIPN